MHIPGDRRKHALPPDQFIEKRNPPAPGGNGDAIGTVSAGIIPAETVDAVCISVKLESFNRYGRKRWVLEFSVAYPEEFSGTVLKLFLQDYDGALPVTSRLYQAASVATGSLRPRQCLTKTAFLGRMFRCKTRLAVPKNGSAPYSVIDSLLEKLTG
jgi:hypothetical protein